MVRNHGAGLLAGLIEAALGMHRGKKFSVNAYASAMSRHGRIPKAMSRMVAAIEIIAGTAKFRRRLSSEVFRHESNGPSAVSSRSPRKMGMVTRLKNGGPTVTLVPWANSE